jgi:hypothetical protein
MRLYAFRLVINCILCFLSLACTRDKTSNAISKTVCIKTQNGKYTLYRNGQPFFIKGVAGFTNLKRLKEAGGNTIRVWDTTKFGENIRFGTSKPFGCYSGFTNAPKQQHG